MNDLLGGEAAPPLADVGPASAEVARAAQPFSSPEPLLAGVFWLGFTRATNVYRAAAASLGASDFARPVVVPHAEATRFDLLLMDPKFDGEPAGRSVNPQEALIAFYTQPHRDSLSRLLGRTPLGQEVDLSTLLESSAELARGRTFGIAIVREPDQLDTNAVSPALSVKHRDKDIATIGVLVPADGGTYWATTADHALGGGSADFTFASRPLKVHQRHPMSDSCLLEVIEDPTTGRVRHGLAGPLRGVPPPALADVFFDGAASGPTQTQTQMQWDLCLLDPQPDEMCRIYTKADTIPGDSGAALIDDRDQILGFAYRRSRYASRLQFSSWIWAEQVCAAHHLYGCSFQVPPN